MEFYAYHGCLEHEKKIGGRFLLSVSFELDTDAAAESDDLADTLNYQEVYDMVRREMEQSSHLIEHLAARILRSLSESFPQMKELSIKLSKLNPPLGGKTAAVSIEIKK